MQDAGLTDDDDVEPQDSVETLQSNQQIVEECGGEEEEDEEEDHEHDEIYEDESDSDEMRERWPDCDMCGIADEQTKDFNDGNGWVCIHCRDAILAAGGEPELEPEPQTACDAGEHDAEHEQDTKRRRYC